MYLNHGSNFRSDYQRKLKRRQNNRKCRRTVFGGTYSGKGAQNNREEPRNAQ